MKQGVWSAIKEWVSDVLGTRVYFRFLEKEDRKRRLVGQFLTLITVALGFLYLIWHFDFINWKFWYSFVFFLAELIGLVLFEFFAVNAWFLRFHSPRGVPSETPFSVDIFITVAGEPIEFLKETVEAAAKIDYPAKKVYVLDDKGDPEYRRLAERYGCGYFAREEHDQAKAGNLNYAFRRTSGDLILTLDADQIPRPNIVNTLTGYFKFPSVSFVQTKQDFRVPKGDPYGNMDRIFYNVMQAGKDTDNAAFSCGSGVIYRRKALEEIGGFSTWNLVEDVHTSMLLHDRGWRSIYYNYPLTKGTAPAEIYGVYKQRRQWAADSLRMLFWDNPFRRKGLSLKQKFQYFHLGFVYLVAAFVMPLFFLTPIVALLTNHFVLTTPVRTYVLHRFPYFIAMSIAYGIITYPTPYMRAFQMWTGLFPAFIHATWIALRARKKKPSYQLNVKPTGWTEKKSPWLAVLPQGGIILLSIFSMIYTFITGVAAWDFYLLNLVWGIWAVWTMSGICFAAVGKHRWPEREEVLEKSASFLLRTKELLVTVGLSIIIVLFFVMADMSKVDRSLTDFRFKIISALGIEKTPPAVSKELPKVPEVVEPYPKEASKPSDQSPPEALTTGTKEVTKKDAVKEEEVTEKETQKGEVFREENWVVNVISVKTKEEAMAFKERLMAAGFPAYSLPATVRGEEWVRVRVGFFKGRVEAQRASEEIEKKSVMKGPYWITKVSSKEMKALGVQMD